MDINNLPPIPDGFKLKENNSRSIVASKLPPIPDGFKLKTGNEEDDTFKSFGKSRMEKLNKVVTPQNRFNVKSAHPYDSYSYQDALIGTSTTLQSPSVSPVKWTSMSFIHIH